VRLCERTVAAKETVTYSCDAGFTLVNLGVRFCYRSVAASASTVYECGRGYRLVSRLVGGSSVRLCERTVAAAAAYSCDSGYTRSGRFCSKYIYTSPRNGSCPAGYTAFFNGFAYLCRKKVTVAATVTYSCSRGYTLSGSRCTRRVAPTATTTYSCDAGYTLSGRTCTRRVAPTPSSTYSCDAGYTLSGTNCTRSVAPDRSVVYDCDDAPAGYTLSGSNCVHSTAPRSTPSYHCNDAPPGHTLSGAYCVHRVAPDRSVVYDCDKAPAGYTLSGANCVHTTAPTTSYHCKNAPAGYTLSGTSCVKTTTKPPTRPTIYTCRADYTRTDTADKPTCTQIDIIDATVTTTPRGCDATPPGEPPYQLQEDHIAGTVTHTCERTVTVDATITNTYTCPTRYKLNKTTNGEQTKYTCKLNTH
jgi:conjugal transfer mating pair stabilization protein TraN